jgi:hypothetical protein
MKTVIQTLPERKAIKIESNVPLPPPTSGPHKGPLRLAIESMKVGQSFVIGRDETKLNQLYKVARTVGVKVATRQVNCESRRIWRVE